MAMLPIWGFLRSSGNTNPIAKEQMLSIPVSPVKYKSPRTDPPCARAVQNPQSNINWFFWKSVTCDPHTLTFKTELDTHDIPKSLFSAWDSCSLCSWHVQIGDILVTPAIPFCSTCQFQRWLFINFQGFQSQKTPGTWRAESSFGWT